MPVVQGAAGMPGAEYGEYDPMYRYVESCAYAVHPRPYRIIRTGR